MSHSNQKYIIYKNVFSNLHNKVHMKSGSVIYCDMQPETETSFYIISYIWLQTSILEQ